MDPKKIELEAPVGFFLLAVSTGKHMAAIVPVGTLPELKKSWSVGVRTRVDCNVKEVPCLKLQFL
jgi:hypothetical protein